MDSLQRITIAILIAMGSAAAAPRAAGAPIPGKPIRRVVALPGGPTEFSRACHAGGASSAAGGDRDRPARAAFSPLRSSQRQPRRYTVSRLRPLS